MNDSPKPKLSAVDGGRVALERSIITALATGGDEQALEGIEVLERRGDLKLAARIEADEKADPKA